MPKGIAPVEHDFDDPLSAPRWMSTWPSSAAESPA